MRMSYCWKKDSLGYISVTDIMGLISTVKATEFGEITQNNDQYAVQGHSRSLLPVPIKSPYVTSYLWITVTYIISCTILNMLQITGQISGITEGRGAV